jgi:hypothetical protein
VLQGSLSTSRYLEGVAELLGDAVVRMDGNPWTWSVVRNGRQPPIRPLLDKQDAWLRLMIETRAKFAAMMEH